MARANCNVADFLLEGKPEQRIALRLLGEERTYGELHGAAAAFASYFNELGCHKGDRVILAAENSFFWVGAYLGILHAGLVCLRIILLHAFLPPNQSRSRRQLSFPDAAATAPSSLRQAHQYSQQRTHGYRRAGSAAQEAHGCSRLRTQTSSAPRRMSEAESARTGMARHRPMTVGASVGRSVESG